MPKFVGTAAEAAACVGSGETVGLMHACGEPSALVNALVARAGELRGVRILTGWHGVSSVPYAAPELAESFIPVSTIPGRATGAAIDEGRGEFLPLCFGEFTRAIREGNVRVDVALLQVSPPFADGLCSLGVSVDYARAMLEAASHSVALVNTRMPALGGEALVSMEAFDTAVEIDGPLLVSAPRAPGAVAEAIGRAAAALVPDGATLQVGVGTIPDALLAAFGNHRDLGVHSGMIGDGIMRLHTLGVITNTRKAVDPGRMVAGSLIGSEALFDEAPHQVALEMRQATYTHDAAVLAAQEGFVAVNSALEVDLHGNANAEVVAGRRVSGPGGQPEFAAGAAAARNAQSLICLPSTARNDTVSRIVARFPDGAPVTTPGEHVTAVVTEYGAADLRGLAPRARAEAIANVAHPTFRATLLRAAAEF